MKLCQGIKPRNTVSMSEHSTSTPPSLPKFTSINIFLTFRFFSNHSSFFPVLFSGQSFYQHPALSHRLLPPVSRNYSADIARRAFARKVRLVHHDSRYIQVHSSYILDTFGYVTMTFRHILDVFVLYLGISS